MKTGDFELFSDALKNYLLSLGDEILRLRNDASFRIDVKADNTLVTNVDCFVNDELTRFINRYFPKHAIIGEETENKQIPSFAEYLWFIDPIDGTKQFTTGSPDFYVMLGLLHKGNPEAGFIYKPSEKTLLYGFGQCVVEEQLHSGTKVTLLAPHWHDTPAHKLTLKHVLPEVKEQLEAFDVQRAPYTQHVVEMTAPLYNLTNGYVSHRRTYLWDFVAPAAIMLNAGYQVVALDEWGNTASLHSGIVKVDACWSMPSDTPDSVLNLLRKHQ